MILPKKTLEKYGNDTTKLSKCSEKIIIIQCDYCGAETEKQFAKYNNSRKHIQKDCCSNKNCINKKRAETWATKYPEGHPNRNKIIQNKRNATNIKKYGVSNVFQNEEIKNKSRKTTLEKYGTEYALQNKDIQNKQKKTNKERYGVEYLLQNRELKTKQENTCKERYGFVHPMNNPIISNKLKSYCQQKYGVDYLSQIHMPAGVVEKLNNKEWLIDQHITQKKCLTQIAEELGLSSTSKTISDYCKKHGIPIQKYIVSTGEKEICSFLDILPVKYETSNRTIISPKELDIFLPEHNIAIEFCGLYWHSDVYKENNYHANKLKECNDKGIRLITIFEDEWINKPEIVKNRLKNILGVSSKIQARKCTIKKEKNKEFVEKHHIQGYCNSTVEYSLYYDGCLVAVMSFGKPRFNKDHEWELLRYVSSNTVIGGAGKLFSAFIKEYSPKSVISYCDLRWGDGKLYEKLGFKLLGKSKPAYYYTKNQERYNRLKFQKKKLISMGHSAEKTEKSIMTDMDFNRIYDCGNLVYSYTYT